MNLGDLVKDSVTGYKGIITAKTIWLHGCVRCLVQPQDLNKDGTQRVAEMIDEPQLVLIKANAVPAFEASVPVPLVPKPAPRKSAPGGAGRPDALAVRR